jgi:hypothetical protein
MAFCMNCGTQVFETAKFCSACGGSIGIAATTSANAPAKKGSSLLKILVSLAAVLILLGCIGVGAAYYLLRRVAAKVADSTHGLPKINALAQELPGIDSQTPASSSEPVTGLDPSKVVTPQDGQCALFTKEELTKVLGTTFTHADADATGCSYKGDAPREWVRTESLWKGGRKPVQEKKDAYQQLSHNMPKANIPIQPYPGVGDEAWVNLWNVVTACKGNAGIVIDLRYYHDSDERTKMLTNAALARLRDKKLDFAPTSQAIR